MKIQNLFKNNCNFRRGIITLYDKYYVLLMSKIETLVDTLEAQINKAVNKIEELKQANLSIQQELQLTQKQLQNQKQLAADWEEKYEALKVANTILGSDDSKRETKLKINALIREIDYCIAELSQ
ncbi:hypothetical protein [Mangrovimonas cancribranchiae]|uniref:Uncharacterized protein n=1 Tax=Mangrovimonas cancribranchiae TaxID=3080055 RepID=A0AAU6P369_9FLAO